MTGQLWERVESIFQQALEKSTAERTVFLNSACGDKTELRRAVEDAIAAFESGTAGLGAAVGQAAVDVASGAARRPGSTLGPYRLIEAVGAGGMGAVYLAERIDERFHQRVAIKLMGAGLEMRPEAVRRFVDERQILAGLAHPNIARLLDGGYSQEGAPYIVMEYVDGVPITTYCEAHELGLAARLRLFQQLARGVHYAHQHLIIHRDIKPANILVTAEGVPKLLDFGVAKLTDQDQTRTHTVARAMTPDYASPEQLRGDAMTTATDVYSLGVLLYELVTGQKPYRATGAPPEEVIRNICLNDPPSPSAVRKEVPGDIDAIVRKAMRKEPEQRYASVADLADDIDRHLSSRPVRAREGSFRYIASRFARRHRAAVAVVTAVALLVAGSGIAVVREAHVARQERDHAQRRFNDVRQLAHSVIFDLEAKIEPLPGSTPVRRDLIATAIAYLDRLANEAAGDPTLQKELAEAYLRIGDVQGNPLVQNLGDTKGALESLEKAQSIARTLAAAQPSLESQKLLVQSLRKLGAVLNLAGATTRSEATRREALQRARDLQKLDPSNDDAKYLLAESLRAMAVGGKFEERERFLLEALPLFEALLKAHPGDDDRVKSVALVHKSLAGDYLGQDQDERAFPHLQRAMELDEARLAANPDAAPVRLDVSFDYSQFSQYYDNKHDYPKALEVCPKNDGNPKATGGGGSSRCPEAGSACLGPGSHSTHPDQRRQSSSGAGESGGGGEHRRAAGRGKHN